MGERKMNIQHLAELIKIGELAVQQHKAQNKVKSAERVYIEKLIREGYGRPDPHADPGTDEHDAILATKEEYAAFKEAKRIHYNIKRRLQTACRKF